MSEQTPQNERVKNAARAARATRPVTIVTEIVRSDQPLSPARKAARDRFIAALAAAIFRV